MDVALIISLVNALMVTSAVTQPILQDTCPVVVSLREPSISTSSVHPCGDGNWRQIAYLNMSNPSQQCPSTFREYSSPERSCGRPVTSRSCVSVFYSTNSYQYDRVCGRIIGYYWGRGGPDAFFRIRGSVPLTADDNYVDGLSVTHGSPRVHIWTFAIGYRETPTKYSCPCIGQNTGGTTPTPPPSFVGDDYFCEAEPGDPLWDGTGCTTSQCCTFNSPPWFNRQLSSPTTDSIEVRLCGDEGTNDEDAPVGIIEIYVL